MFPLLCSWAIGMSHMRSTSHTLGDADFPYIYKKGPAFGMPGVRVDGMDVLKVRRGPFEGKKLCHAAVQATRALELQNPCTNLSQWSAQLHYKHCAL